MPPNTTFLKKVSNEIKKFFNNKESSASSPSSSNSIREVQPNSSNSNNDSPIQSTSEYGACQECGKENTWRHWCLSCNSFRFQQNFDKWASGNKLLDEIIRESQLNC